MVNKAKPKVFVSKFQPSWDYSQAAEYGEVVFVTDREFHAEPSMPRHNETVGNEIAKGMQDYIAGIDFIVLTAAATVNMAVAMHISGKAETHNVLRWSNRGHSYELYKIRG